MKVGFTGTRKGMTEAQKEAVRYLLVQMNVTQLHHGGCVGADLEAAEIARSLGVETVEHLPKTPGAKALLDRNKDIVCATGYLIACPHQREEILRSGTWATVRYGRKYGSSVIIIQPNGEIVPEFDELWWG